MNKLKITIFNSKKSFHHQIFADFGYVILRRPSSLCCEFRLSLFLFQLKTRHYSENIGTIGLTEVKLLSSAISLNIEYQNYIFFRSSLFNIKIVFLIGTNRDTENICRANCPLAHHQRNRTRQ